jgi:hypothetical protein
MEDLTPDKVFVVYPGKNCYSLVFLVISSVIWQIEKIWIENSGKYSIIRNGGLQLSDNFDCRHPGGVRQLEYPQELSVSD